MIKLKGHFKVKWKKLERIFDEFDDLFIPRGRISTLWSLGNYDGPAAGIVEYKGNKFVANSLSDHHRYPRKFWMIKVSQERMAKLEEYVQKRLIVCGNSMKYNSNGTRDDHQWGEFGKHATPAFSAKMNKWVEKNRVPDYYPEDDDEVIGYFFNWKA